EFLHQGPFLGLADLHAQRLDLFRRLRYRFTGQIFLDVRHVQVFARLGFGGILGLAAALGAGLGGSAGRCRGRLRGAARFLLHDFFGGGSFDGLFQLILGGGFVGRLGGGLRKGHGLYFRFGLHSTGVGLGLGLDDLELGLGRECRFDYFPRGGLPGGGVVVFFAFVWR